MGIGFTADLVTAAGVSYGGGSVDTSGGDVVAYVRLTRTVGSWAAPTFSGGVTGYSLAALAVHYNGAVPDAHNSYFDFEGGQAPAFALTPTTLDFKVTIPGSGNPAPAGTYTIDLLEGVLADGGVSSAAVAGALSVRVAYALDATPATVHVSDGTVGSTEKSGVWWGPVTTGLFLRLTVESTSSVPGYSPAGIRTTSTVDNDVSVDGSKLVFTDTLHGGVVVGTFRVTGAVHYTHGSNTFIDVGLDTTSVLPSIYTVTLGAGAFTDAYGVTSQAAASSLATINVGFGLTVSFWKSDGGSPPSRTAAVAAGEWVDGTATLLIKVTPDAAARAAGVLLNNVNTGAVPATYAAATLGDTPGWAATGTLITSLLSNTLGGVAYSATASGREAYTYASGGTFTAGLWTGDSTIGGGTLTDATGLIFNHAMVTPDLHVGFNVAPSLQVGGSGTNYAGVYGPYLSTFPTQLAQPLNAYAGLTLTLTVPTGNYAGYTSSIFSSFPLASTTTAMTAYASGVHMVFTLANIESDKVAPGVYDLTLPSGSITIVGGAGIYNAELRFRVIIGMPAVVFDAAGVVPATLRASNQSAAVYITRGTSLVVRQYLGTGASVPATLSALFGAVLRNGDATLPITALVGGATGAYIPTGGYLPASARSDTAGGLPLQASFALDITGLSDGTDFYTFTRALSGGVPVHALPDSAAAALWAWPSLSIIVDRTAPTPTDTRYASTPPYLGAAASLTIPTMFVDTVSGASAITITSVTAADMHGFVLVPGGQGAAALAATSVMGPEGDVVFTVTGADEAGNTAVARLTVTLYAMRVPTLSIADGRAVFTTGTLVTGAAQLVSTLLPLTVSATFPEAVAGVVASHLGVTGWTGVAPIVAAPASSANGRVWTWAVTVAAANLADAQRYVFTVNCLAAATTVSKGLLTGPSSPVYAVIDSFAPVATPAVSSYSSVVGIPFFAVIPTSMHSDLEGGTTGPSFAQNHRGGQPRHRGGHARRVRGPVRHARQGRRRVRVRLRRVRARHGGRHRHLHADRAGRRGQHRDHRHLQGPRRDADE